MRERKATGGEVEVLEFLDELKNSGERNMLDNIAQVIEEEFGYVREEAKRLHKLWINNHNEEGDYSTIEEEL